MSGDARLSLAVFQQSAVEALTGTLARIAQLHEANPSNRRAVALQSGVMLLQAPTGSGKTLMLGRALEAMRGALPNKSVWFWFAPYSGLVSQTRAALVEQCGSLRMRDVYKDREASQTRDGDVFIQTWASVASRNKDARKVRRTSEDSLSLDDMLANLRDAGFYIGVVIDEAHLNFGASAMAAAEFYLQGLQPDFTILATATPNDDKLEQFEKVAGIEVASRIVIDRGEVVAAGLNKRGLMLGVLKFQPEDLALIDLEQGTLQAGWSQHCLIKERLAERGLSVMPLMLIQVEDQASGGEDPVVRIKQKLREIGAPEEAIAVHTSGEPDPDFHTLAYDPSKEVLIFKVAVATGFDAPRAWTLISVRPSRGKDFGLQIVGRIMRVHPVVRPVHGTDPLLDRGYVFLTDATLQEGLSAAATELKAVRHSIELITDTLDVVQYGDTTSLLAPELQFRSIPRPPPPPSNPQEREMRLRAVIDAGFVLRDAIHLPTAGQDRAIETGEALAALGETPLFGRMEEQLRPYQPGSEATPPKNTKKYRLRTELGIPKELYQEVPLEPHEIANGLVQDIAREFCQSANVIAELHRKRRNAKLGLRDLFQESASEERSIGLLMSNARIAEKAQQEFEFDNTIDPRDLQRALIAELRKRCEADGIEFESADLRRAIDLAVMKYPEELKEARGVAKGRRVALKPVAIPDAQFWPEGLPEARRGGYGVFPERLNKEERDFAQLLDDDDTGTVNWWMRNPENETWATRLLLPSGKRFFPDFIVGVAGRSSRDAIALVEIKDDGVTGRLQSDNNVEKIRVRHREYRQIVWVYREGNQWVRAQYAPNMHRIVPKDSFQVRELVYPE